MAHPDPDIRVSSHRIFSAILMPTIICPWSTPGIPLSFNGYDPEGTHLVALSGYASSRIILAKFRLKGSNANGSLVNVREKDKATEKGTDGQIRKSDASSGQYRVDSFQSKSQSMVFTHVDKSTEGKDVGRLEEEVGTVTFLVIE